MFPDSCAATGVPDHRAAPGFLYCELHREDFRRQKRRWYSARNNLRRKATTRDPGPWEDWLADIKWSPPDAHGVLIDADGVRVLRSVAEALASSMHTIDYVIQRPGEIRSNDRLNQQRLAAQVAIAQAVDVLQRLAKRDPHALEGFPRGT